MDHFDNEQDVAAEAPNAERKRGFLGAIFGRFRRKAEDQTQDESGAVHFVEGFDDFEQEIQSALNELKDGEISSDDDEFSDLQGNSEEELADYVDEDGAAEVDPRVQLAGLIAARADILSVEDETVDADEAQAEVSDGTEEIVIEMGDAVLEEESDGEDQPVADDEVPAADETEVPTDEKPEGEDELIEGESSTEDGDLEGNADPVAAEVAEEAVEAEVAASAETDEAETTTVEVAHLPVAYAAEAVHEAADLNDEVEEAAEPGPEAVPAPVVLRSDGTPLPRHRLGEYVLNKGLITVEALDAASRQQEVTGERIGQILVANGFLSDKDRVEAILATSSERIAQENVARSKIPSDILDEYSIMISAETDETIYVSTMADEETVRRIVRNYYPGKQIQFVSFLPTAINGFIASMKKSSAIDDVSQTKETMLDRILYRALNEGASDIHILPRNKSYTTMFRLLGVRRIVYEGALDEYKTVIAQIKDKARMDLAERRKPQDGGFQIEYSGKMIDLRVATVPTAEGESCIMRVLDPDRVQPSLGQLGITEVEKWRKGFNQQHGLCLICGPTGSGKTTTLNSSIKEMDRFGKAIYTIEDPVEYRIPYAGQVSVNTSVGLNFATAVRAFMRADPDVIVLGEVRDEETARNAIKAADTGHLVLATLHTGSILGAVSRLKDLGIAPRELRYLLRSVLVQTLIRTTCKHCGGDGCIVCKGSGYGSRTVVSECEYFEDSDMVDRIINSDESSFEVTWTTMIEDAVNKYRKGITDREEIIRVFGASAEPYLREEECRT